MGMQAAGAGAVMVFSLCFPWGLSKQLAMTMSNHTMISHTHDGFAACANSVVHFPMRLSLRFFAPSLCLSHFWCRKTER